MFYRHDALVDGLALDIAGVEPRLSVMLVEDDQFLSTLLGEALASLGARVQGPFRSLEDGLAFARTEPRIDAAILDINLGTETVFPLAELLQSQGVGLVFHSALVQTYPIERLYPGARMAEKPMSAEDLMDMARSVARVPQALAS